MVKSGENETLPLCSNLDRLPVTLLPEPGVNQARENTGTHEHRPDFEEATLGVLDEDPHGW